VAGRAHRTTAGSRAGAAATQPVKRSAVSRAFRRRAQREELIGCDFAVEDVAVGHSVSLLDVHGAEYLAMQDGIGEIGGELGYGRNNAIRHLVLHLFRPFAPPQVIGRVLTEHRHQVLARRRDAVLLAHNYQVPEVFHTVADIVDRLKTDVAPMAGIVVYFQPVQDIQISTRMSRAQYQYTLVSTDRNEVVEWADKLTQQLRANSEFREVASEAQEGGPRVDVQVDRGLAGQIRFRNVFYPEVRASAEPSSLVA